MRYDPTNFEKRYKSGELSLNLAKDKDDLILVLLICLFAAAKYPMNITEEDVHREISQLCEDGEWDNLAVKGLNWIQEIASDQI